MAKTWNRSNFFRYGEVGNRLNGIRESEIYEYSANKITNWYITEAGNLKAAKKYRGIGLVNDEILEVIDTRYHFFIIVTIRELVSFNKTTKTPISRLVHGLGLNKDSNISVFENQIFTSVENTATGGYWNNVYSFDKNGLLGISNYLDTILTPLKDREKMIEKKMIARNLFEINHSLLRQFGPEGWTLYKGKHLLSFVDNHDVTRVASILENEKHLPLIYALAFGMPGIPCIYYGSEWGAKARKEEGDPALRTCFPKPEENELTEFITNLVKAKKESKALNYGDFKSLVLTNFQCVFERNIENERVMVAINLDENSYIAHFDAQAGRAHDLITGQTVDFGGGLDMPGYSAMFLQPY